MSLTRKRGGFVIKTNAPLIITFVFIYGLFVSSFNKFDIGISSQLISSLAVLYLFYIIYDGKIDFNKVLLYSVYFFSIVSILSGIEGFFFGGGIVTNIVSPYNLLSLDERDIGFGDVLYSRLISLPIVFVAFAQLLFNAKFKGEVNYFGLILFSTVILISFTRALILCWFLLVVFVMLYNSAFWKKAVSIFFLVSATIWIVNSGTISVEEASNKTKIDDINNFVVHMEKDAAVLLIGDGLGSYFYRFGKGEYAKTENTVLDFIRYFGVPLTVLIFIKLLYPFSFIINKRRRFIMFSFLLYILMSFSNPTLFNSFGCIAILWYWYNMGLNENE